MEKFTPLAKNFTLPPAVAAVTNSTSVQLIFLISPSIPPQKSESLISSTKSKTRKKLGTTQPDTSASKIYLPVELSSISGAWSYIWGARRESCFAKMVKFFCLGTKNGKVGGIGLIPTGQCQCNNNVKVNVNANVS